MVYTCAIANVLVWALGFITGRNAELCAQKVAAILENAEIVAEYRARLANLSWLMKSLFEPIARKANS